MQIGVGLMASILGGLQEQTQPFFSGAVSRWVFSFSEMSPGRQTSDVGIAGLANTVLIIHQIHLTLEDKPTEVQERHRLEAVLFSSVVCALTVKHLVPVQLRETAGLLFPLRASGHPPTSTP